MLIQEERIAALLEENSKRDLLKSERFCLMPAIFTTLMHYLRISKELYQAKILKNRFSRKNLFLKILLQVLQDPANMLRKQESYKDWE